MHFDRIFMKFVWFLILIVWGHIMHFDRILMKFVWFFNFGIIFLCKYKMRMYSQSKILLKNNCL